MSYTNAIVILIAIQVYGMLGAVAYHSMFMKSTNKWDRTALYMFLVVMTPIVNVVASTLYFIRGFKDPTFKSYGK